jgi:hypothetical protein
VKRMQSYDIEKAGISMIRQSAAFASKQSRFEPNSVVI